jgi:hypothetical protein
MMNKSYKYMIDNVLRWKCNGSFAMQTYNNLKGKIPTTCDISTPNGGIPQRFGEAMSEAFIKYASEEDPEDIAVICATYKMLSRYNDERKNIIVNTLKPYIRVFDNILSEENTSDANKIRHYGLMLNLIITTQLSLKDESEE